MRTLERISVSGFKSIRELKDFELRQLNVMIGANGAGKSNFLKIFELLYQVSSLQILNYSLRSGGTDAILHFGQKTTPTCIVSLQFGENGQTKNYFLELSPALNGAMFPSHQSYSADQESFAEVYTQLSKSRPYHFDDTSDSSRIKQIGDIGDNQFLRPDASNLAAFLYLLQNHHSFHYQNIVETVRMVAPFFGDFALHPLPENDRKMRLEWKERRSDAYRDASYFSDGTLRFICLAALLLQPQLPMLLIIDEPELGLHPSAINLLAELLASAATQTQVLISTQSVSLVNQFQPEDIIVVDRENGNSTFNRLNAEELTDWLNEYSLGELWEKNIFGGRP